MRIKISLQSYTFYSIFATTERYFSIFALWNDVIKYLGGSTPTTSATRGMNTPRHRPSRSRANTGARMARSTARTSFSATTRATATIWLSLTRSGRWPFTTWNTCYTRASCRLPPRSACCDGWGCRPARYLPLVLSTTRRTTFISFWMRALRARVH